MAGLPIDVADGAIHHKSGPGGTRTHDPRIKSPMLYQLSYKPLPLQRSGAGVGVKSA